jgi:hypothetical protein
MADLSPLATHLAAPPKPCDGNGAAQPPASPPRSSYEPPWPPTNSSEYAVREIHSHREHDGKLFYLVDWRPCWIEGRLLNKAALVPYWEKLGTRPASPAKRQRKPKTAAAPRQQQQQNAAATQRSARVAAVKTQALQ